MFAPEAKFDTKQTISGPCGNIYRWLSSASTPAGGTDAGSGKRPHAPNIYDILARSSSLQNALREASISADAAFATSCDSPYHNRALGVVRLTPGTYYVLCMTAFNAEERLIWRNPSVRE